ncbi:hypothetical protein AALO_G00298380 [Alosa alosa]|uniref:RRM domain-containing protein n=1 Tax=Alosa alosa TaxID=278164 RepID=A0AAV6FGN5_9TELE|nr:hypothetical protein AALO_G00298380 [Alosa alosa]
MSHPMYNPGGGGFSGSQRPMVSNQYGLGGQPGMDMGGSRIGPGAGPMSGPQPGMMPSMRSQQMGFPLGQRPPQMSQDIESSIEMHIRGAREEVRLLNRIMPQQPKPTDPRLHDDPREEMGSFSGQRGSGRMDEPSSADWSHFQPPNKLFSSSALGHSSSSSSLFQTSGFGGGPGPGRGGVESQSGPRSGPPDRPPVRYTSESASSILASFGLSNEDLELLSHYPDDQLTPDNLPFILRDIRIRKAKRTMPDTDDRSRDQRAQEPRQSKVIDYGHSSKYGYTEERSDSYGRDPLPKELPKYERDIGSGPSFGGAEITRRPQASPAMPISSKPPPMDHRNVLAGPPPELKPAPPSSMPGRDPVPKSAPPAPSCPVVMPPTHAVGSRAGMMVLGDGSGGPKPSTWSPAFPPPSNPSVMKRLPTPTMMNDYSAATPRIFPHTCSLCNVECVLIKDWIEHQNTNLHIESCRRLRKQYPDWNVDTLNVPRNESKPPVEHRSPKRRSKSRSHSWTRSPSPRRHHGSTGRRPRSRSRSPGRYRRSRSRSRSPRRSSRSSPTSHGRRRSRSPQSRRSRSPPSRRSRSHSPRNYGRRSPPRSGRRVSPRRPSPHRRPRSSSSERLAKKLIESSAGLNIKDSSALEAVVNSLAPTLLAELAKRKSAVASSSASRDGGRKRTPSPSPKRTSSKSSSSSTNKSTGSFTKKKAGPGTACLLRFKGVPHKTTDQELVEVIQPFGKINHAFVIKAIEEASVCMEREEDARDLANFKNLRIHGRLITICREEELTDPRARPAGREERKVMVVKKERHGHG